MCVALHIRVRKALPTRADVKMTTQVGDEGGTADAEEVCRALLFAWRTWALPPRATVIYQTFCGMQVH